MNKESKHGVAMNKPLTGKKINLSSLFILVFLYQLCFIDSDKIEASDEITQFQKEEGIKNPSTLKKKDPYAEGEILVRFKENITQEDVEAINKGFNTTIIKKVKTLNLYLIKIPEGESIENMIKKYSQLPEVEYSEPNYIYQIDEGGKKHDE